MIDLHVLQRFDDRVHGVDPSDRNEDVQHEDEAVIDRRTEEAVVDRREEVEVLDDPFQRLVPAAQSPVDFGEVGVERDQNDVETR